MNEQEQRTRNIYVRRRDRAIWATAEREAQRLDMPLSRYLTEALRRRLEQEAPPR